MLKKIALALSLSACFNAAAHAELVLVAHSMNFATNTPTTWHFVDFSEIKKEPGPDGNMIMTLVSKHPQPQKASDGTMYIASATTSRYGCQYGGGAQMIEERMYSHPDMHAKSLVYKTPKPSADLIVMPAQWIALQAPYPLIVGHPQETLMAIACGRLTRKDFK